MLKDVIILAIGAVFGLGATMAGVAVPAYLPSTPSWIWHWLFWGGIALMAIMCVDGLWLVIQRPSIRSAILVNIGLIFIALSAISVFDDSARKSSKKPADIPLVGTLRFVTAVMELEHSKTKDEWSGRIKVEIKNNSDRLVSFHATTAGNINGVAFDYNKVEFDGYIYAQQSSYLVSNRIAKIPIENSTDPDKPFILGIYEYELRYGYRMDALERISSRGAQIAQFRVPPEREIGARLEIPITITFYNEIEK